MLTKTFKNIKRVAFFGDADAKTTDQHFIDAFNTAKLLAEAGYIIVDGGGPGVMLAATLGAKTGKGKVEVVVIDEKINMGVNFEGSLVKNTSKADKIYRTKNIQNRTEKLIEIADAYVVFKGGTGTMAELALVWEKAKFDYGHHEPLIFFGDCWKDIVEDLVKDLVFDKVEKSVYELTENSDEVLKIIENRKGIKKTNTGLFGQLKKLIDKF